MIAQLRDTPMLAALPDDVLERLAANATAFDAPAGQVLIQPNQPGSGLLILTAGKATVELGARTITCEAGECLGELSLLLDDVVHVARVRAETDVHGLAISRREFAALLDADPRVAVALLRVLARRLVDTDRLLATMR
jgi:CRP-like cAMP-binding protein